MQPSFSVQKLRYLWVTRFHVAALLQFTIGLHAALLCTLFALKGPNEFVDTTSVFLSLLLDASLILYLYWANEQSYPHIILLVLFTLMYFLLRILAYIYMPPGLILYPFRFGFSAVDLNRALSYVVVGNLFLVAGFQLASRFIPKKSLTFLPQRSIQNGRCIEFSHGALLLVWLLVLGVHWYFYIWKAASIFDLSSVHVPGVWITYFINPDILAIVTIVLALSNISFLNSYRRSLIILLIIYLSILLIGGSRSAPMRIGLITIFMMLVQFGNFKTSLRTSVIFCLAVVLMTGASYPVGEGIRLVRSGLSVEITMESVARKFGRRVGDSDKAISVLERIAPMVNRLGVLDYAIEVLSERGNRRKLEQYMNFEYGIKNVINNMVLGSPFPEAEVMTSRIMSIVYRDFTMSRVKQHFLSEPWTAWGVVYVFFGWWGGLAGLFVFGFLSQVGFEAVTSYVGKYGTIGGTVFLYYSTFNGLFHNLGLDYWLTIVVFSFFATITTLALLHLADRLLKWRDGSEKVNFSC